MDTDWTFSSQSWLWEEDVTFKKSFSSSDWTWDEDKACENALATHYNDADRWEKIALAVPGKTIEDIKLHYEALSDDVEAIESGKVCLPPYQKKDEFPKKHNISPDASVQRGVPWTEEEHRRFLYGLQRFGRGDWKSISRYSVRTKSNSQVASHAQKYFKRLKANEGRRPSINDITSVQPESLLALEKATTSCMPEFSKEKPTRTGNHKHQPRKREKASANAVKKKLIPTCPKEVSTIDPICPNEGSTNAPICPNKASTTEIQIQPEYSNNAGDKLPSGFPNKASTEAENQMLEGHPKETSTNAENEQFPEYCTEASANAENQLLKDYSKEASTDSWNQELPAYSEEILINIGNEVSTETVNQLFPGYPNEALAGIGNQMLPPPPFAGMPDHPFFGQSAAGVSTSSAVVPACGKFSALFGSLPTQMPCYSMGLPAHHP